MLIEDETSLSQFSAPPQLPTAVLDRLRLRANHLKMLPAVATQALEIVNSPNCSINQFAAVVERDATLAAEILRLANSVLFAGSRPVLNLHQAVVRLGIRQCKNLILASSFSSMMKRITLDEECIRTALCRHGFLTALLAMDLNRALNVGFQGEEFAGGLIHDIGRMLISVCFQEQFRKIDPMSFLETPEILVAEEAMIGTNHCEIGAWFVQKNGLPDGLFEVVRFHHLPERSFRHRRFVALIATCDHMANYVQTDAELPEYSPLQNPGIGYLEESGVSGATTQFAAIAHKVMESAGRTSMDMLGF